MIRDKNGVPYLDAVAQEVLTARSFFLDALRASYPPNFEPDPAQELAGVGFMLLAWATMRGRHESDSV